MRIFRRFGKPPLSVRITVNGQPVQAMPGETVATALFAAGYRSYGPNPATGRHAGAYCLIGQCFGCLCTVDGREHSQACLIPVFDGMVIETAGAALPPGPPCDGDDNG